MSDWVAGARRDGFTSTTRWQALRWASDLDFHPEWSAPLPDPHESDPTGFFRWRFCIGWAHGEDDAHIAAGLRARDKWTWVCGAGALPEGACPNAEANITHWHDILDAAVESRWESPVAVTCAASDSWAEARARTADLSAVEQGPSPDALSWRLTRAATFLPVDVARLWFDTSHQDGHGASMGYGDDPVVEFSILTDDEIAAPNERDLVAVLRRTATYWDARATIARTWGHFHSDGAGLPPGSPRRALHRALDIE